MFEFGKRRESAGLQLACGSSALPSELGDE